VARFPWTRRTTLDETVNTAPVLAPPRGYTFGVPVGGTTEYNQTSTGSGDGTDRRTTLESLYQSYLACPWSSACVDTIARTITAGGLEVVWDGGDEDVDAPEAPPAVLALRALLGYVNPTEDIRQLMRGVLSDLLVFGDAFLEVVWLFDQPVALYSLDAPSMAIIADEHGTIEKYVQVTEAGQRAEFETREVIHFSLDTPRSGLTGVSPTQKALLPITTWLFTAAVLKEVMRKGDPVNIHADFPTEMSEDDIKKWRSQYAVRNLGPRNVGVPITTRGGATVNELKLYAVESYLKTKNQARDEIVSTYGVPPSKVGIIESGNLGGGTGTEQDKTFRVNTCGPTAEAVLEKLVWHLMRVGFGVGPEWLMRFGDIDWRDDKVVDDISSQRLRDGRWTLNRSRADIGEPPVEGGDEAVLIDRQNLVLWSDMADMSAATVAGKDKAPAPTLAGAAAASAQPVPADGPVDPAVPAASGEEAPKESVLPAALIEVYRARRLLALETFPTIDVAETHTAPEPPPVPVEVHFHAAQPEPITVNVAAPSVNVEAPAVTVEAAQVPPAVVQVIPGSPVDITLPASPTTTRTTVTRNDYGSMTSITEPE
jgi:hypothetical protein